MPGSTVAIIPARGGSKGVRRKNVRPLCGEPLVAHSIRHALQSSQVDETYVTTDDDEIAEVSLAAGARIIKRPPELSGDRASSESAIIHAMDEIEKERGAALELVAFLQCTSPIRRPEDIDRAIELLKTESADSLLSVVETHRFFWSESDGQMQSLNYDYRNRRRRQDFENSYMENGSLYVFRADGMRAARNRLFGKIVPYIMSPDSAFEIDDELDFVILEAIMKHEHNVKGES